MMAWHVVKTKPRKEDRVSNLLSQATFKIFLPKIKKRLSLQLETQVPLFPSYLFIQADFSEPQTHRLVKFTRGVTRILGDENGPIPLSEDLVDTLMSRTRDGALIEQDLLFREGDEVRVKVGILKDLIGIIERNMSETGRVKILFKWLTGNMRAVLRYNPLERIV